MKKRVLPFLLAVVMVLALLSASAFAAQSDLPDWYFLVAIFKNTDADVTDKGGNTTHIKYSMSQNEIDYIRQDATGFETSMNSFGVIRTHVDVVEIDIPVTEKPEIYGSNELYVSSSQVASLLKDRVTLGKYDYVFCAVDLNMNTNYTGITTGEYENGAGHSCINYWSWDRWTPERMPGGLLVHEFLHFIEVMSARWGQQYELHKIGDFYTATYGAENYVTVNPLADIILNRAKGEFGTGVNPEVWKHPPRTCWTTHEWPFLASVPTIESWAFWQCIALSKVTIPGNIAQIGGAAFQECVNLSEVTILPGVTSIGNQAFNKCTKLTVITIPASITKIGKIAFYNTGLKDVYYEGTEAQWKAIEIGEHNDDLTRATIHYNSPMPEQPTTPTTPTNPEVTFSDVSTGAYYYDAVQWAVAQGITAGTSATTFSPDQTCTVEQILTFLWRAAGSPEPAGTVSGDEYYAKAMQWAKEQDICTGFMVSSSPESLCTRIMAVYYMWMYAGAPSSDTTTPFTDLMDVSWMIRPAVPWALENNVTVGTSATTFSPNATCTRGQIVTFLYRAFAES